ncbi:hypothetical protein [Streptomyces sp. NPDC057910]|uniref:hypothetical protein n=1 Tax=Streptomyces sp. NPDC057910 TaxID=3346278 RepID=UPI0036E3396D
MPQNPLWDNPPPFKLPDYLREEMTPDTTDAIRFAGAPSELTHAAGIIFREYLIACYFEAALIPASDSLQRLILESPLGDGPQNGSVAEAMGFVSDDAWQRVYDSFRTSVLRHAASRTPAQADAGRPADVVGAWARYCHELTGSNTFDTQVLREVLGRSRNFRAIREALRKGKGASGLDSQTREYYSRITVSPGLGGAVQALIDSGISETQRKKIAERL